MSTPTSTQVPKSFPVPYCAIATPPTLKQGDFGPAVEGLHQQIDNITNGLNFVRTDGNRTFGPETERFISLFQHWVFLSIDGIVGPKTWRALCADAPVDMPILQQGSAGSDVIRLQQRLNDFAYDIRAGYPSMAVDGDFGPITRDVVISFQREEGLSPDGIVGPITWKALGQLRSPVKRAD